MVEGQSSAANVFNIPELLISVFVLSRPSDQARLCQVTRRTFSALIPLVWKSIGGENLLSLATIPSFQRCKVTEGLGIIKTQIDGKSSTTGNNPLNRFNIYAPFVQHLTVHNTKLISNTDWSAISSYARTQELPLLPNLQKLRFMEEFPSNQDITETNWISTFTHRSTICIEISYSISYSATSSVLAAIAISSPNIRRLTLRSSHDPLPEYAVTPTPWFDHLKLLTNLEVLGVSEVWFCHHSILQISQLPKLKVLVITPSTFQGPRVRVGMPPRVTPPLDRSNLFPALQRLVICFVHPHTFEELFDIQHLFSRITSLYLLITLEWFEPGETRDNWLAQGLFPLLRRAPLLQHLEITLNRKESQEYDLGAPNALEAMTRLPLRWVRLNGIHLGRALPELNLSTTWSNVTSLSLLSQRASLETLTYFATMPKLVFLTVILDLTAAHTPGLRIPPCTSNFLLVGSYGSRVSPDFDTAKQNARGLISLWPQVRCSYPTKSPDETWRTKCHLFNQVLKLHRLSESREPGTTGNTRRIGKMWSKCKGRWEASNEPGSLGGDE